MRTVALPLSLLALALAACAEPIDRERDTDADLIRPVVEVSPAAPETIDAPAVVEAEGNVPSLAEVQYALRQCVAEEEVLTASCATAADTGASAGAGNTQFICRYTLSGTTPESEREAIIAANGDTYTLVEIPEDCATQ